MQSLFLFTRRESFLHRLDPRSKFLFILSVLFFVLVFDSPEYMLGAFLTMVLILWILGRISPLEYWPVILLFLPLIFSVTLIQGLTRVSPQSTILLAIGPVRFSEAGVIFGLSIGLRLATMGITFMTFAMTTTPKDVGLALYKSGIPFRYAYLGTFGLRFLPLIKNNLYKLQDARAVRGDPDVGSSNPLRRVKSLPMSLFPLMANAFRQSGETAKALELRGYGREQKRTTVYDIQMKGFDYFIVVISIITIISVLYARYILGLGIYEGI